MVIDLDHTEIWMAYDLVERANRKTPLILFEVSNRDGVDVEMHVKMDTMNSGGSFKDRGSLYFIDRAFNSGKLKEGDTVVSASAGNHAKGVAKAASNYNLNAVIYMAEGTPSNKVDGTVKLGADVRLLKGDYHMAVKEARSFSDNSCALYVPAYDHQDIILGQSTVATEVMIQLRKRDIRPDFFIFPFGGGGLATGGSFALKHFDEIDYFRLNGKSSRIHTFGVQARNFNTMFRSFQMGSLQEYEYRGETVADGIRVPNASENMLELSLEYLDDMFDISEEQIRESIRRMYNSSWIRGIQALPQDQLESLGFYSSNLDPLKRINIIEGAAAAAFACAYATDKIPFRKIATEARKEKIHGVIIASGNNIDEKLLEEILSE